MLEFEEIMGLAFEEPLSFDEGGDSDETGLLVDVHPLLISDLRRGKEGANFGR